MAATAASREAVWLVYTGPLTFKRAGGAEGTKVIPGLADALPRVSADGLTYRFRFRRGLRYSDGSGLKASDFEHTVKRLLLLGSPSASRYEQVVGARAFARKRDPTADIEGISADDRSRSVRISLRQPDGVFPVTLAAGFSGLVPARTPALKPSSKPRPGIGPYRITASRPGGGFVLERNRRFRLPGVPPGNLDEIRATVVPDPLQRARGVISERFDVMQDPPPRELLPELRSEYRDRFEEHATISTLAFVFDSRRRPFDKRRVRRAAGIALDGPKLRRLLVDRVDISCNVLPSAVPGYRRLSPCPLGDRSKPPDLVRANQMVKDAKARRARVTIVTPRGGRLPEIGRFLARTLEKIGLRPTVRQAGARRPRANVALVRVADALPHPAELLGSILHDRVFDDVALLSDYAFLLPQPLVAKREADWASLDRQLVERGEVLPVGSERRSTFLSERLDFENCARFHPVYGNDLSSFCLR